MNLSIKAFVFNAFQVNTYVIYNKDGDGMLVDPACYAVEEQEQLSAFIDEHSLTVRFVINTHAHVDHLLGNSYVYKRYGVAPMIHKDGLFFYEGLDTYARSFGFEVEEIVNPVGFLEDDHKLKLGEVPLKISYTPGHADGSICIINMTDRWIISGDLLFRMSIGRTDLPTGDFEKLIHSIQTKILIYADDFVVYPGHGSSTTVGFERLHNPYL